MTAPVSSSSKYLRFKVLALLTRGSKIIVETKS